MFVSITFHGFGNFPCIILLSEFLKFCFHDEFLIYIADKFHSCYWVSHPSSYLILFVNLGNGLLGIPLRVFHDCINWCGKIHLSCGWAQARLESWADQKGGMWSSFTQCFLINGISSCFKILVPWLIHEDVLFLKLRAKINPSSIKFLCQSTVHSKRKVRY